MNFNEAQQNMRYAYFNGGPGIAASGLIWFLAGIIGVTTSERAGMLTLFFGGMLIYPLGILFAKLLRRPGNHKKGNPLGTLAMESTFILFLGLFMAFAIAQARPEWFFPTMLLAIGSRYLIFSTIYGIRTYWMLGAALAVAGVVMMIFHAPFASGAFAGGVIELLFSVLIVVTAKNEIEDGAIG